MNIKRFMKTFNTVNKFGVEEQGMNRLAYTEVERKAVQFLIDEFKKERMSVIVDAVGNVIARREGIEPNLPAVACGSHIDTVYNGGKYDGTVGVIAGLELVRYLNENNIKTKYPIEVIIFACEESARFGVATIGSKAMMGFIEKEDLLALRDRDGISFEEALEACELQLSLLKDAHRDHRDLKAFYELHIEQGPVLEKTENDIGIVSGIAAPTRFEIVIRGEAAHTGTTPFVYRRDAMIGAAEVAIQLEKFALEEEEYGTVATVSDCAVFPGAMNVVPSEVVLKIDIRSISMESKERVVHQLNHFLKNLERDRHLAFEIKELSNELPLIIDESMVKSLSEICDSLQYSYKIMPSGAGHDAMNIGKRVPTGMIFIPSRRGLSHNKEEFTSEESIVKGVTVLIQRILQEAEANISQAIRG